jgi:hypothetical protein
MSLTHSFKIMIKTLIYLFFKQFDVNVCQNYGYHGALKLSNSRFWLLKQMHFCLISSPSAFIMTPE